MLVLDVVSMTDYRMKEDIKQIKIIFLSNTVKEIHYIECIEHRKNEYKYFPGISFFALGLFPLPPTETMRYNVVVCSSVVIGVVRCSVAV